jgi:hypothetical protein
LWLIYLHIRQIDGGIGCASFEWVDEPMDKYLKDLVRDLRDAVSDQDEEIERMKKLRGSRKKSRCLLEGSRATMNRRTKLLRCKLMEAVSFSWFGFYLLLLPSIVPR